MKYKRLNIEINRDRMTDSVNRNHKTRVRREERRQKWRGKNREAYMDLQKAGLYPAAFV